MSRLCRILPMILMVVAALPTSPHLAAQEEKKSPDDKAAFKRRDVSTDEELRKQLQFVPEAGLDQPAAKIVLNALTKFAKTPGVAVPPDIGIRFYTQFSAQLKRPDLLSLPWRSGPDSQLGKEIAEGLHVYSTNLRDSMRLSVPIGDVRPDPDKLTTQLAKAPPRSREKPLNWDKAECVPTLAQMLQTENTPLRMLMIDMLAKIDSKDAGAILAQRAIFDLSPQVRQHAVEALAKRPNKEYQQALLDGLRWPWQPAADHAAEAIAALKVKEIVPEMVKMLKEPDPKLPYAVDTDGKKTTYIREIVRINHLSNCVLCHAPSMAKGDLVRGRIPVPGEDPPPLYYGASFGQFVRADTTFLRQDFSLVQPVSNPGKWPGQQRFDYLLRTRKATAKEVSFLQGLQKEKKLDAPYQQREALLFALREVTGTDLGSLTEKWLPLLNPIEKKE